MKLIILMVVCALIVGCKNKNYYKTIFEQSFDIEISKNFNVVQYSSSYSTTSDYSESFGLQFSKKEFTKIFRLLRPKRAIADSNLFYLEKTINGVFSELTFDSRTCIIYYNRIEE